MRSKTQEENPPYKYFVKMYNLPSGISNKDWKIVKFPKSNFSSLGGDGGCPIMGIIVVLWKCESHFQSRFQLLLNSATTQSQVHRYKYTNKNTWIQIRKYKYVDTNAQIQIHGYKCTKTITQIQILWKPFFKAGFNFFSIQLPLNHKHTNTQIHVHKNKYINTAVFQKEEKYYLRKM